MTIRSKVHNYGHEHESSWPPRFGTGDTTPCYIDPVTKELKPGYPPPPEKLGEAPQVIFDSMPAQYHEGAGRVIESRREWNLADKQTGKLTFSTVEEPRRHVAKGVAQERKELAADRRNASLTALKAYKENPKEVSAKVAKRDEKQREQAEKTGLSKLINEAI